LTSGLSHTSIAPPGRVVLTVTGVLALAALALVFADPRHAPNFDDGAGVYWAAGAKVLRHQTVYDVTGHYTFNYPPFAALFYAFTFAAFPVRMFEWVFYGFSVAGWAFVVITLGRAMTRDVLGADTLRAAPRRWDAAIPIAFVLFYGVGWRDELKLGQTMIVPLVAATAFILVYQGARARSLAGDVALAGLLTFAVEMKIYFAVLLALMAARREWRILGLVVLWHLCLSVGFVALWHGPSFALAENLTWFSAVRRASGDLMRDDHNMSVMGAVVRTGAPAAVAAIAWIAVMAAFLYALWRTRAASPLFGFAICLAAVAPLNPIAWPYWMLLGFPAMFVVLAPRACAGIIARSASAMPWKSGASSAAPIGGDPRGSSWTA